ncbi:ferritin-like domain-containing protein [Cyclobacterium jeungdonense]|uniref:DUF892 family protein n=1 Tax=Cyclobacterium jeungdonense TaxID=708087 RepID=A0ABT8CBR7_9BACT|nr:DUF892 family protein [Cyclobacterium jeungdonense]MDN3690250.1 DUF892 family protein [Cyclobacterium jeungdonense]
MKKALSNLQEALGYQLKNLYDAEKKIQKALPECSEKATSPRLQKELKNYLESTFDKINKLERVFNYLMDSPTGRENLIMDKMLEDTHHILKISSSDELRDVLITSCLQNIIHYKIAGYGSAHAMAMELDLRTVTDLLHEVLMWEKQSDQVLTSIAVKELNVKATKVPKP